mmetsp:Transcript_19898/g.57048  ORF Transcript_19898/g.57048 Transcript_19898/m.57048 type:complete len:208 (-) Transcript_19898:91-714(-)
MGGDRRYGDDGDPDEDSEEIPEIPADIVQQIFLAMGGKQLEEVHVASLIAGILAAIALGLDCMGTYFPWWSFPEAGFSLWEKADGSLRCNANEEARCGVLLATRAFAILACVASATQAACGALAFHTRMEWTFVVCISSNVANFVLHWLTLADGLAAKPPGEPTGKGFGFYCFILAACFNFIAFWLLLFTKRRIDREVFGEIMRIDE